MARQWISRLMAIGLALCAAASALAGQRTTLLVPATPDPSWRDAAFLAAVPAVTVANNGTPSLIALDAGAALSAEVQDYARRFRPERVFILGGQSNEVVFGGKSAQTIPANSAEEAALALSRTFWPSAKTVVLCRSDDYEAALVAAPLAALLRSPLLFIVDEKQRQSIGEEVRRLNAREMIVVNGSGATAVPPKADQIRVTSLTGAREAIAWARKRGLPVRYLAAVNPTDRTNTVIRKLSLAGAMFAAGRGGLVVTLNYDVRWKIPFISEETRASTRPATQPVTRKGAIDVDGRQYAYTLTGGPTDKDLRLRIEGVSGAESLRSGDAIELGGKRYAVTLGEKNGAGRADLRLTWPRGEQVCDDLRGYYQAAGGAPEYLCLVGFPDAIPQVICGRGGVQDELTSDLAFSNADADPFAEICVGRVIAENLSHATLFASRVLTYSSLLAPSWQDRACQARWENTYRKLFENVGFEASTQHTTDNLKWLVPPSPGRKGKRAGTFEQDSPLADCCVLAHTDHSSWREIGHTFAWDAEVLMAPTVVESGGCSTAAIDREPDFRSVVSRLLRKGAVAFVGNARLGVAASELQRQEFWNGVLAGEAIGQAHCRSINSALLTVLDKEPSGGLYTYQVRTRTLFGDPAFAPHLPNKPRSAPACVTVKDDIVTVRAPAQWWPVKMVVPEDWKLWAGKELYVVRGAGVYVLQQWCREGYDREETFFTAEVTTKRRVKGIEQLCNPPTPLGWRGKWHIDENADGSRTCRWAVRMIDFDQIGNKVVNAVEKIDYRVTFE